MFSSFFNKFNFMSLPFFVTDIGIFCGASFSDSKLRKSCGSSQSGSLRSNTNHTVRSKNDCFCFVFNRNGVVKWLFTPNTRLRISLYIYVDSNFYPETVLLSNVAILSPSCLIRSEVLLCSVLSWSAIPIMFK